MNTRLLSNYSNETEVCTSGEQKVDILPVEGQKTGVGAKYYMVRY